jgi:hypothetical protein
MKTLLKFILIWAFFTLQTKCELQSDLFMRIAKYSLDDENIKEVFLSKIIDETFLGAKMLCEDFSMEFLRIESQEEVLLLFRVLRLHWLAFDDELFIDGIKTSERMWKFVTSGNEVDPNVFDFLQESDDLQVGSFIKVIKNGTILAFGTLNLEREKRKFLCQKTSKKDETNSVEENQTGLLKVEVPRRMFDRIGSYESFTNSKCTKFSFWISGKSGLSGLSFSAAQRFCKNFGMKLVDIDSREKYEALVKFLVKPGVGIDTYFMIGAFRESFIETNSWANTINLNENQGNQKNLQCVSIFLDRLNEKGRIVYFDCNDDYKYQRFICENVQFKNIWTDAYPKETFEPAPKISKKESTGMKFLGSIQISKEIGLIFFLI